jgi:DNA-binding transcriptional MocR family regulator
MADSVTLEEKMARRARGKSPSPIRELLAFTAVPGLISLGGGYPSPETFVFSEARFRLKSGVTCTLKDDLLTAASQYGPSEGQAHFKEKLALWHERKSGKKPAPEEMVVLNGCQEGLFIAAYLFCEADDRICLSEPTYPGAVAAFSSFCRQFIPVEMDRHGIQTSRLEEKLQQIRASGERLPKLIYCIPNGHNPGGVSLSLERRRHLVDIAGRFDILLIEDDPYELIRLTDAPPLPSLQSLDRKGLVIRLDSFSKIFIPGLRLGYATAHPDIIRQFVLFKQSSNLHTSSFNQMLIARYLEEAGIESFLDHIKQNCAFYRKNRDVMIDAAGKHLEGLADYHVPDAGMFIWFELPERLDTDRMIRDQAEKRLVLCIPGSGFSTRGGLKHCLRATFGSTTPGQIEKGIERLAAMIRGELEKATFPAGD